MNPRELFIAFLVFSLVAVGGAILAWPRAIWSIAVLGPVWACQETWLY